MPRARRSRRWVFTLNNYTQNDEIKLQHSPGSSEWISYCLYGRERGLNNTPHLQGVLFLRQPKSLQGIKDALQLPTLHLEIMQGPPRAAINYCKKDGDVSEWGTPPAQGRRSDLEQIRKEIMEGAEEKEIADSYFTRWVVYRRSFKRYKQLCQEKRNFKSQTYYIYGTTGTGKTRCVHEKEENLWVWPGGDWFDGYEGHDAALFDDFRSGFKYSFALRLLDRYAMDVPIKGGHTNWCPKRIYITSNILPLEQWPNLAESKQPFIRRLDHIWEMTENSLNFIK